MVTNRRTRMKARRTVSAATRAGMSTSTGTQAADVEQIGRRLARARQCELEERRYALHMELAARLTMGRAGKALQDARQAVAKWAVRRTCSTAYITAWGVLLQGSQRDVGARLAEMSLPEDGGLFQNTPFSATLGAHRPAAE